MNAPTLLDLAERQMAETSLDAYAHIQKHLPLRDLLMCLHVDDYLNAHAHRGYTDVTGRELAAWLNRDVLTVRPRLTGAQQAGLLATAKKRKSRHPAEAVCFPYYLAVPRAAVERAIRAAEQR
jgi:hypothetical protein